MDKQLIIFAGYKDPTSPSFPEAWDTNISMGLLVSKCRFLPFYPILTHLKVAISLALYGVALAAPAYRGGYMAALGYKLVSVLPDWQEPNGYNLGRYLIKMPKKGAPQTSMSQAMQNRIRNNRLLATY